MIKQNMSSPPTKTRRIPYLRVLLLAGGTVAVLSALTYGVIRSTRPPATIRYLSAAVHKGDLSQTDSATGEVVPANTFTVAVPSNATLSQLPVHLGQTVSKGAVLATFTDPALASQVASQQATVLTDENQVNLLTSQVYAASRQADITQAHDTLAQAQDQLSADQALGVVTAPDSGQVSRVDAVGTNVAQGQTIAVISGKSIVAALPGTVKTVNVAVGQTVSSGTQILTLTSPSLTAKILGDESQVAGFQAQLDKTESQDSANQLATVVDQAKAQLTRDQQTLEQDQQALSGLVVKAPYAGEVTVLNASAPPGTKLLTMDSLTQMVTIPIPETQINAIHAGQPVTISLPGLAGKTVTGTVQGIAPVGTYANGVSNFPVYVTLSGSSGVRYGMSAQVSVVINTVHGALLVPLAGIHSHGTRNFVELLASNGQTSRVPVHVLLENPTMAAVKSKHLSVNDHVVTASLTPSSGKLHLKTKGRALHKGTPGGKKGRKGTP